MIHISGMLFAIQEEETLEIECAFIQQDMSRWHLHRVVIFGFIPHGAKNSDCGRPSDVSIKKGRCVFIAPGNEFKIQLEHYRRDSLVTRVVKRLPPPKKTRPKVPDVPIVAPKVGASGQSLPPLRTVLGKEMDLSKPSCMSSISNYIAH